MVKGVLTDGLSVIWKLTHIKNIKAYHMFYWRFEITTLPLDYQFRNKGGIAAV